VEFHLPFQLQNEKGKEISLVILNHSNKDTAQKALHFGTGQTASSIVIPVV
jgi:hypothetical protein